MMEREPQVPDAIGRCAPNIGFAWDEEKGIILWESKEAQPTQAEIDVMMVTLQEEYDAQEYARNRQAEYPSIADQLDEIYHNGINSWKAVIKVTKDKYPKG